MVGIDGESADADGLAGIQSALGQRFVKKRDEGLGKPGGERAESCAEPGAEKECLMHKRGVRAPIRVLASLLDRFQVFSGKGAAPVQEVE